MSFSSYPLFAGLRDSIARRELRLHPSHSLQLAFIPSSQLLDVLSRQAHALIGSVVWKGLGFE
jgi:hypothetical protein